MCPKVYVEQVLSQRCESIKNLGDEKIWKRGRGQVVKRDAEEEDVLSLNLPE